MREGRRKRGRVNERERKGGGGGGEKGEHHMLIKRYDGMP